MRLSRLVGIGFAASALYVIGDVWNSSGVTRGANTVGVAAPETRAPSATEPSAGITVLIHINPLQATLILASHSTATGIKVPATLDIRNGVQLSLTQVAALIEPLSGIKVTPTGRQVLGRLAPGVTKSARWTVCSDQVGTYLLVAQANAQDAAGKLYVDYGQPQSLIVTNGSHKC